MLDPVQSSIDGVRRGDPRSIEDLLVRYLADLRAFVRARCGPTLREQESNSDIVQSVCREVLADAGKFEFRGESEFKHWLFTAAEHKLLDRARYWNRDRRTPARTVEMGESSDPGELVAAYSRICSPSEEAQLSETIARIEHALDRMPASYRDVVLFSRFMGLDTRSIAEKLGHDEHYTRTLLSRGLAKLATLLDEA